MSVELRGCPRCGSTELAVHEDHVEHGVTDPGPVYVRDGVLVLSEPFYFAPGDPIRVDLECSDCLHRWRSRWPVGSRLEGGA